MKQLTHEKGDHLSTQNLKKVLIVINHDKAFKKQLFYC